MWLFEVSCVLYLAAVCAGQDGQTVTLPASTPAVTTIPFVPPKPVLALRTKWLDVFPTEKVVFSCSVSESFERTFIWKRDGTEITTGSDPSLSLSEEGSVLTITAAQQHSGSYSCSIQSKNVEGPSSEPQTLSVYQNKPKPKISRSSNYDKMFPGESITFTCSVEVSTGWEYMWYHDGQKTVTTGNEYSISSIADSNKGQYQCKASRGPFYTEKSDSTSLEVSNPPTPVLTHQNEWLDVFEGDTLTFHCKVNGNEWTYIWFHDQQELKTGPNIVVVKGTLNINPVSQAHEGNYTCKAQIASRKVVTGFSNSASVTVYKTIPTPILSKDPAFDEMYIGESVTFTCKVDVATGWTYQWYSNGNKYRDTIEDKDELFSLEPADEGKYFCNATRGKISTGFSKNEITQKVLEIPVPTLKNVTRWLDVFPTETVIFSCVTPGGGDWTYSWYKDMVKIQNGPDWSFDSNGATLTIASASAKHKGQYTCKGHLQDRNVISNSSSVLTLTVYDEKPTASLTRNPTFDVMFPGEQVTYSCNIGLSSGWEYLWYKGGVQVKAESSYSISLSGTADSGSYTCQAKRGSNPPFITHPSQDSQLKVKEIPVPVLNKVSKWLNVFLTERVELRCGMETDSGMWTYIWYKDSQMIETIDHGSFGKDKTTLSISSASPQHRGNYSCSGKLKNRPVNSMSSSKLLLEVLEIPVPVLNKVTEWLDVFPNERVELRCGMKTDSEAWAYMWYKDSQMIETIDHGSFDKDRTTLSISSVSPEHGGNYSCSGNLKDRFVNSTSSSELRLEVYDEKPSVTLIQEPNHSDMHTEDSVSFTCHVNVSSGWTYEWHKNNNLFPTTGNKLSIKSVQTKDSGSYTCRVKRGSDNFYSESQPSIIDVRERPQASLVLLTGWSEVFSTDSLVLKCEVMDSQDKWNYTWYKEDTLIGDSHSEKHTVTPQNDPDQSHYICNGNRIGRPSYSRKSVSFKTKNLLLKRRVLLSISGCIFFGIIGVFLGCIILRFVRKPASNDDKNEEDLFMTMAQQKDCDAPCPLAVYITDASLNAPLKEGDENGTICSETTPLPITTQEDQAVTTDSQETTETNGGLLSFQK